MASASGKGSEPPNPSMKPQYPPSPGLLFPPNARPPQIGAPMVSSKTDQNPYYTNQGYRPPHTHQLNAMVRPPSDSSAAFVGSLTTMPPALSRPPVSSTTTMAGQLSQPSSTYGSFPPPPSNRPVSIPGPFSKMPIPSQGFSTPIPGSIQLNEPRPNNAPISGPIMAGQVVAAPTNQTPFPAQTVNTNFASAPPPIAPPRGPPSNAAISGPIMSGQMRAAANQMPLPTPIANTNYIVPPTAPPRGPPSFSSGIASAQPVPQAVTSYTPTMSPAPSFGLQASQFPPYGGQPAIPLDGQPSQGPPFQSPYQGVQNLAEEFQSLSMTMTAPGSMGSTFDLNTLPRPSGRAEHPPASLTTNCHSRYFRLTSGSLPNSQSVSARWHLPLGVVVHPLAEAPLNVSSCFLDFMMFCNLHIFVYSEVSLFTGGSACCRLWHFRHCTLPPLQNIHQSLCYLHG